MIIEKLDLRAYGRFTGESLDLSAGPAQFHLVYGPNESGKSTCLRAISSLLFGIPTRTADSYLHANAKLRIGATLRDDQGQRLVVVRRKNGKTKLHAEDDKTPVDPALLQRMLGGIDEATFHHRFGLSHEQLVAGGKAVLDSKGELGEILFAAGAGVGQLNAIRSQLENESKELFVERGKKTINTLVKELEEKRSELRQLQVPTSEYVSLRKQLSDAETESQQLNEQIASKSRRLKKLCACREAHGRVPIWKREKTRLETLRDVPTLDENFAVRRHEASVNRRTYTELVDKLRIEIETLQQQLDSTPLDPAICEHEREIVSLFQSIAGREAKSNERENLVRLVGQKNRSVCELLRDLGNPVEDEASEDQINSAVHALHVTDATKTRIAELAATFEAIRQKELDSLESLQAMRRKLGELDDEIERNPEVGDPAKIESVLSEIGSASNLVDQVDSELGVCSELESECERLVAELRLAGTRVGDVVKLKLPTVDQVDRFGELIGQRERGLEDADKAVQQLRQRKRDVETELQQLHADQPLPTEAELSASRRVRDQHVDQLNSTLDSLKQLSQVADAIRTSIRSADEVVDTIRRHHQLVATRSSLTTQLERTDAELEVAGQCFQDAKAQLDESLADWEKLWHESGVDVLAPREMQKWLSIHRSLLDKHSTLDTAQARLQTARRRVERSTKRLAAVLREAWNARPVTAGSVEGTEPFDSESGLEMLHDRASSLRHELVQAASKRERLISQRDETLALIPAAEAKHEASVQKRRQWDDDWKHSIACFSNLDQDASPGVINARLRKIELLVQEIRQRDQYAEQIQGVDEEKESFLVRVAAVAKLCGLSEPARDQTIGETAAVETVRELYERLQSSKSNLEKRNQWRKELVSRREKLDSHAQVLAVAEGQLAELCREAGVEREEQLSDVEDRAADKRRAKAALSNAEDQLVLIADDQSLEAFCEEVESFDLAELDGEIATLEEDLEQISGRRSELLETVGALKKGVDSIGGGDRAAELNQELQSLSARIDRASQRYARLRVASMILQRSIDHYRSENESPVLKLACEAFEELTCGRYSGLKPEYDGKDQSTLFGVVPVGDGQEELVPVDGMSLGTADALYLAMRIASLEHQLASGHSIPVVIDDCLIQLDDRRAIAAMKRFSKLSQQTQVILFTHHEHLIDLARRELSADEFHVHRLAN